MDTNIKVIYRYDGTNFPIFVLRLKDKLFERGLDKVIEYGMNNGDEGADESDRATTEVTKDQKLQTAMIIRGMLTDRVLRRVRKEGDDPTKIFKKLAADYLNDSAAALGILNRKFEAFRLNAANLEESLEQYMEMVEHFADLDQPKDEATVIHQLLTALPQSYNEIKIFFKYQKNQSYTIDDLESAIRQRAIELGSKSAGSSNMEKALSVKTKKKGKNATIADTRNPNAGSYIQN
jgi:hypothetical protein